MHHSPIGMEMHVVCHALLPRAYASHVREGGRACGREKRALTGREPRSLDVWSPSLVAPLGPMPPDAVTLFHLLAVQAFIAAANSLTCIAVRPHTISFLPVDELGNDRTALTVTCQECP